MKISINELIFYFPHTAREISVDTMLAWIKMYDMKMAKWNLLEKIQICPLNLDTQNELQVVKLNADLKLSIANVIEQLLKKYKDVFVWTYKDLRGIPPHLTHHWIELNTNIPTSHQT
jgi:hypothetical protein